eukprot:303796_1
MDTSEESKTSRLLNDHTIDLHKDKVLPQILPLTRLLLLLTREKVQLMTPRLIFNFINDENGVAINVSCSLWKVKRICEFANQKQKRFLEAIVTVFMDLIFKKQLVSRYSYKKYMLLN